MRYDAEHKQKTHERILREAARAVRGEGPQQVGVAAVMSRAGLTHGGFYAHFPSKDALVAASIEHMFEDSLAAWDRVTRGVPPEQGLAAYVDFYLSQRHCEQRAQGCPMAALASDVPRLPADARRAFAAGTRALTAAVAGHLRQLGVAEPQDAARSVMNELVGAMSLARCEPDAGHAQAVLEASRRQLKARLGLR